MGKRVSHVMCYGIDVSNVDSKDSKKRKANSPLKPISEVKRPAASSSGRQPRVRFCMNSQPFPAAEAWLRTFCRVQLSKGTCIQAAARKADNSSGNSSQRAVATPAATNAPTASASAVSPFTR